MLRAGIIARRRAVAVATLADAIIALSPWAYYQLGETVGAGTYADSSGNGRDLSTINATVTAGSTGIVSPGTSVDFDGTSGFISSSNNQYGAAAEAAFDGTGKPFTLLAHVNFQSLPAQWVAMHLGVNDLLASRGFWMIFTSNGRAYLQVRSAATEISLETLAGVIAADTTYQVAVRYDPSVGMAVIVNGAVSASNSVTSLDTRIEATSTGAGSRIMLGAYNASTANSFTDGRLQHCAIFTSALSDAQLLSLAETAGLA